MPKREKSEFDGAEGSSNKTAAILGIADKEALWALVERPVINLALRQYVQLVVELRKASKANTANNRPQLTPLHWKGLLKLSRNAATRPLLITDTPPKSCGLIHPRKLHIATNLHLIFKVIRHTPDVFTNSELLDTPNPRFHERDVRSAHQLLRFYWISGPRPKTHGPDTDNSANMVEVVEPGVLIKQEDTSEDSVEWAPA
jgi:hypothetical protein